jgi:hypothetical protein
MHYVAEKNLFKRFENMRESLIFQYKKGDLTKKEYVRESHDLLIRHQAKPFQNVDSFEKAVFNYQYYNTMAKYTHMKAEELRLKAKHSELFRAHIERKDRYYRQKDQMTWKAVQIKNFCGIEAYYINVKSLFLKQKIFEIVFHDHPTVIFHSRGEWLKNRLDEEGLFNHQTKHSVIENYVNEKY